MTDKINLTGRVKNLSIGLMVVGLICLVASFFTDKYGHHSQFWANLLHNNVFFLLIALAGAFFIAANYLANTGWHVLIKRVPEAMMSFIPFGAGVMLFMYLGLHDIYHWTHDEAVSHDKLLAHKSPYLNVPFFMIRMIAYLALWILLTHLLRRASLKEDIEGGFHNHKKSIRLSAFFLLVFGVSTAMASWDWIMSITPHWYSTLFGWYIFASFWVSGIATIVLLIVYLRKNGFLPMISENHLHDLGKFMFAFSIFWTYLWFSQFMLIWYANIPEETIYFKVRFDNYKPLFFLNVIINFAFPFLILMTRDAKRRMKILTLVAIIIIAGHWLDFYLMIVPSMFSSMGVLKPGDVMGSWTDLSIFLHLGVGLGYVGAFILVVFNALSKASLVPKNHPYLEESINHQT